MTMTNNQTRTLQIQSTIIIASLVVQYALGMYANLFVSFPDGIQGGSAWEFAWQQGIVATHIVLGILLVIGAIVFIVRAFVYKSATWKAPSVWGLVGIVGAAACGSAFIPSQSDAYSYAMALFFLISLGAYAWGAMAARREKESAAV